MSMGRFGDPSLYTRTEPLALGLLATSVTVLCGGCAIRARCI